MLNWKFKLNDCRKLFVRVSKDEDGATLIEYSLLIGLITVAVIALIIAVGGFVTNQWTALNNATTTT